MKEFLREKLEEEHQLETDHPPFLHPSASVQQLVDAFKNWVKTLEEEAIFCNGIVFVCAPNGTPLKDHLFSRFEEAETFTGLQQEMSWPESAMQALKAAMASGRAEVVCAGNRHDQWKSWNSFAVPARYGDSDIKAWVGMLSHTDADPEQTLMKLRTAVLSLGQYLEIARYEAEFQKRNLLYDFSKRLHPKIDVDSVLAETVDIFQEEFPHSKIDIYLSQDNRGTKVPVKPIVFNHHGKDIRNRAYIMGTPVAEYNEDKQTAALAVPLTGKQGVYGVLQITSVAPEILQTDLSLLSMLAGTAGIAFENARLYEHSTLLINELRLINEITRRLNQSLKLQDVFNFASSKLLSIFAADYSCILQVDHEEQVMSVQATNFPGISKDNFKLDYGFSGIVYRSKEPLIVSDYSAQPIKSKLMDSTKANSLIASPILINHAVAGVVMVAHRKPDFFSYENYRLLQILADHIGLAISNASLHSKVRKMAITDHLTHLYARHYLDEQINLMQRKDFCGALIVLDIDNFKKVNDTYGHQIGDQILIQVSRIIKAGIRDTDIAARWGGEELAIYLPQTTIEHTLHVAERIRSRIADETDPEVTISCGIADWGWEDDKISVENLFYKADMALYDAKKRGKNRIRFVERK